MTVEGVAASLAELWDLINAARHLARSLGAWPLISDLDDAIEEIEFLQAVTKVEQR